MSRVDQQGMVGGDTPVDHACMYLERRLDRDVSLAELGDAVGYSPAHLQRLFRRRLGVSPREYVEALRVRRLKEGLRVNADEGNAGGNGRNTRSGGGATRVVFDAGFGSASNGYDTGVRNLGMTPAEYGAGGRGATIEYRVRPCALGHLLVARTGRGICAVTLGDRPEPLEKALREEFPEADVSEGDGAMDELCERVIAVAEGEDPGKGLPVEVVATSFQWKVWRALRAIPPGETRSYSDVAAAIGEPKAVRAVASACARNRVSILIPCHRVVRSDGTPGEYRWGRERKRRLLEIEAGRPAGSGQ
jgi:AraC family transcriptional regulator, regulatory protein of adaptative response / methylated-DNA-[protein]-cysteine methyltransferase